MQSQQSAWTELADWLNHWFHEPDLEAFQICMLALQNHYYEENPPNWIMVIGPSGSGKTEIVAYSLKNLTDAQIIGALTPRCFLSSWHKNKNGEGSMLSASRSQIWIAKDFTTFLSMRPEARLETAARLREIRDGEFVVAAGVDGRKFWDGKVTMLACATPAFEYSWKEMSGLGERFMTVRWRSSAAINPDEVDERLMDKVRGQASNAKQIRDGSQRLVGQLLANSWHNKALLSTSDMHKLDRAARVVARLRVRTERDTTYQRNLISVPLPETETRVGQALSCTVRTHQDVFHGAPGGVELAYRLALDTIPEDRRLILQTIPEDGTVPYLEILQRTNIPRTTLTRELEDLTALRIIEDTGRIGEGTQVRLIPSFAKLVENSGLNLRRNDIVPFKRKQIASRGGRLTF